jgi:hypothetical protein
MSKRAYTEADRSNHGNSYATETHLDTSFFEEASTAVHDETVSREDEMLDPAMMGDFDGK